MDRDPDTLGWNGGTTTASILESMEQGNTFCSSLPKYRTTDPNHRILAKQCSRFTTHFIQKEPNREHVTFRKSDNAQSVRHRPPILRKVPPYDSVAFTPSSKVDHWST